MKSFVEIPNVDPNFVDFCIYTFISRHVSIPLDNSVESRSIFNSKGAEVGWIELQCYTTP